MKYLITGGAGFIGSNLVSRIIKEATKVIVIDNLITGSNENLKKFEKYENFVFHSHDIQNHFDPQENIDFVIHLASCASPVAYSNHPINTLKSGSIGTINALGIARKYGSKFLLSSTSEVYGDPKVTPQPESYWGNVNPVGPRSMYDESKRFAEAATQAYISEYSLNAKIIRIFNTYGPSMQINDGRVVTNFIVQALKNQDITIYGDGSQTRSFCYVDDLVAGLMMLMESNESGPINIGNPNEFTIKELAEKIRGQINPSLGVVDLPLPQDDPMQRQPVIQLAREKLNWEPNIQLDEGLSHTITDFQKRICSM